MCHMKTCQYVAPHSTITECRSTTVSPHLSSYILQYDALISDLIFVSSMAVAVGSNVNQDQGMCGDERT